MIAKRGVQPSDEKNAAPASAAKPDAAPVAAVPVAAAPIAAATAAAAPVVVPARLPRLAKEECLQRIEQAVRGKAFSPVMGRVISMAASPATELNDLTSVIATDPTLASRII